jgi:hypothetical protein
MTIVSEPELEGHVALLAALLRAQDAEHREAADRLHDDAIPTMYGAALALERLARQISDPVAAAALQDVAGALTAGGNRLRGLLRDLQCSAVAESAAAKLFR